MGSKNKKRATPRQISAQLVFSSLDTNIGFSYTKRRDKTSHAYTDQPTKVKSRLTASKLDESRLFFIDLIVSTGVI